VDRVPQHELFAVVIALGRLQRPDGRVRGERDERGRAHVPVSKMKTARAGGPGAGVDRE
jgi:hypothetical protein